MPGVAGCGRSREGWVMKGWTGGGVGGRGRLAVS